MQVLQTAAKAQQKAAAQDKWRAVLCPQAYLWAPQPGDDSRSSHNRSVCCRCNRQVDVKISIPFCNVLMTISSYCLLQVDGAQSPNLACAPLAQLSANAMQVFHALLSYVT